MKFIVKILEVFGLIGGVATVFGLILAPTFYLSTKIDALSVSLNSKIDSFKDEMHAEMKDFHGRLCAIEESRKK